MASIMHRTLGLAALACSSQLTSALRTGTGTKGVDATCAPLRNLGSHSTVEITVGTPPQTFEVVADTGSNNVIVESCICQDEKKCKADTRCFRGSKGKSTTFAIPQDPPVVSITFGSGPIVALVSTDEVKVGGVQTTMKDSLLLMVDKNLTGDLKLEGLLGLGLPPSAEAKAQEARAARQQARAVAQAAAAAGSPTGGGEVGAAQAFTAAGFLETAGVDRFSMCFNSNADGALRLNPPMGSTTLSSVGQQHWGLDFRGITVGDHADAAAVEATAAFCSPGEMKEGQTTPCGAIPDSGTTLIMGPAEHLVKLFMQICDAWAPCRDHATSDEEKVKVLIKKMSSCEEMATLPKLGFQVVSKDGKAQTLELGPQDWVIETQQQEYKHVHKHLMGVIPVDVAVPAGLHKVCMPAFGTMEYPTKQNGPVWIFGTPFFYKYNVAYDISASPPAMSFVEGGCTTCDGISSLIGSSFMSSRSSSLKQLSGPPRVPVIDTSRPL